MEATGDSSGQPNLSSLVALQEDSAMAIVPPNKRRPFVAEPVALTKKDLGFWIGMAVWVTPPLLVLLVWTIL